MKIRNNPTTFMFLTSLNSAFKATKIEVQSTAINQKFQHEEYNINYQN